METDEFKELYSERYNIEAKNAELKNNYGYDKATTLFLLNMKRIIKLQEQK